MAKRRPKYSLHKATGQARVYIRGVDHYLGEYGSPASRDRYDELITEWMLGNVDGVKHTLTVDDLLLAYWKHAETYYRKHGRPTSEQSCIKTALRHVVSESATRLARAFGAKQLKAARDSMIRDGLCRKSINKHVGRIKRMFRWAVAEEMVKPSVLTSLDSVQGLREGRCEAVESDPVMPVPDDRVDALRPFVSAPVWGLIQVQGLTGMRPGEALIMRACDLNMSGKVWEYTPATHKTKHHGKRRTIFIGPKAQRVIRRFLKRDLRAYLFSPQDVREGVRGRTRQPGERYDRDAYRNAITRACERAFGMPAELRRPSRGLSKLPASERAAERLRRLKAAAEWRREHCWHPHQLRHSAATTIRREAGLDTARTVLGHASLQVAEVYAERDAAKAREIMAQIG